MRPCLLLHSGLLAVTLAGPPTATLLLSRENGHPGSAEDTKEPLGTLALEDTKEPLGTLALEDTKEPLGAVALGGTKEPSGAVALGERKGPVVGPGAASPGGAIGDEVRPSFGELSDFFAAEGTFHYALLNSVDQQRTLEELVLSDNGPELHTALTALRRNSEGYGKNVVRALLSTTKVPAEVARLIAAFLRPSAEDGEKLKRWWGKVLWGPIRAWERPKFKALEAVLRAGFGCFDGLEGEQYFLCPLLLIVSGDVVETRALLRLLASVAKCSARSFLYPAASRGLLGPVDTLMKILGNEARKADEWGQTVLHHAVWGGYLEVVRRVVQVLGRDIVQQEDSNGRTALALMQSDSKEMEELLEWEPEGQSEEKDP